MAVSVSKIRHPDRAGLRLRIVLHGGVAIGPGRADLLQGIQHHGSIAAAGRSMGMSYRRAWQLVEDTAVAFGGPVVTARPGGVAGGHAELTELGKAVITLYRLIETKAAEAVSAEVAAMQTLMLKGQAP